MKKSELNEFLKKSLAMEFIKEHPFVEGVVISDEMWETSHCYHFYFKLKINKQIVYYQNDVRDLSDSINILGRYIEQFKSRFIYDLKEKDLRGYQILDHIIAEEAYENNRLIAGIGHNAGEVSSHLCDLVEKLIPAKRVSIKNVAAEARELIKERNIKITVRSVL